MADEGTTTTTETGGETAASVVSPGPGEWAAGISEDNAKWLTAKGVKEADSLVTSYRELESKFGADRAGRTIVLPKNGDAAEWESVYNALGRPDTADGYGLAEREGSSPELAVAMSEVLHQAGVSKDGAELIVNKFDEVVNALAGAKAEEQTKVSEAELAEWKSNFPGKETAAIAAANAGAAYGGLSQDDIAGIEEAIGTGRTMALLHKIGVGLSEDTLPGTAAAVKSTDVKGEIEAMKADPAVRKAIAEGDYATKQRWDKLHQTLREMSPNPYTGGRG